jgi:hypothetical protein
VFIRGARVARVNARARPVGNTSDEQAQDAPLLAGFRGAISLKYGKLFCLVDSLILIVEPQRAGPYDVRLLLYHR